MNVTENPELTKGIYDHIRAELDKTDRSGVHLTDLIFCNLKSLFRRKGEAPPNSDDQMLMFWIGHSSQYLLAPVHPSDAKTVTVDGITMTVDFSQQQFGAYCTQLAEMKSTRMSSKTFSPTRQEHYIEQMKGYCKGSGVTEADLIVLFLRGSYDRTKGAEELKCWHFQFTQEEIDEQWAIFLDRKAVLLQAENTGQLPERHLMAGEWECNKCECAPMCPALKGAYQNGRLVTKLINLEDHLYESNRDDDDTEV